MKLPLPDGTWIDTDDMCIDSGRLIVGRWRHLLSDDMPSDKGVMVACMLEQQQRFVDGGPPLIKVVGLPGGSYGPSPLEPAVKPLSWFDAVRRRVRKALGLPDDTEEA